MRLVFEGEGGDETQVGISFDNVGKLLDLLPRKFVEHRALRGIEAAGIVIAIEVSQVTARGDHHRIEQAGAHQSSRRHLLQTDAQRQHGNQGSNAHRDSNRRERIAQHRLAQVAYREFGQIVGFHARPPCDGAPAVTMFG